MPDLGYACRVALRPIGQEAGKAPDGLSGQFEVIRHVRPGLAEVRQHRANRRIGSSGGSLISGGPEL